MLKSVFITATDTGVGKTTISYVLAKTLIEKGLKVAYFKPVETGADPIPEDATLLSKLTGQAIDEVVLYTFKNPIAPYVATIMEGGDIDLDKIIKHYEYLVQKYDFVIMEGAGGVLVPIKENYTYRELIKDLNIPVLLVSRANLGTINHTLLTLEALKDANILGVVMNGFTGKDISEEKNPEVIEKFSKVKVMVKCNKSENPANECYEKLKNAAGLIL